MYVNGGYDAMASHTHFRDLIKEENNPLRFESLDLIYIAFLTTQKSPAVLIFFFILGNRGAAWYFDVDELKISRVADLAGTICHHVRWPEVSNEHAVSAAPLPGTKPTELLPSKGRGEWKIEFKCLLRLRQ